MKTLLAVTATIALASPASLAMFSSAAMAAPVLAVSPNGTAVTAPGPGITDIDGNVWQVTPNRQITENHVVQPTTQHLGTLLFFNNAVYQNAAGPYWWKWETDAWVQVSGDPRIEETLTIQSLTDLIQFEGCCIGGDQQNLTTFPLLPFGLKSYKGVFVGAVSTTVGNFGVTSVTVPMDGRALASVNFGTNQVSIFLFFPKLCSMGGPRPLVDKQGLGRFLALDPSRFLETYAVPRTHHCPPLDLPPGSKLTLLAHFQALPRMVVSLGKMQKKCSAPTKQSLEAVPDLDSAGRLRSLRNDGQGPIHKKLNQNRQRKPKNPPG